VITQFYSIRTVAEALACVEAGADHLGLVPPQGLLGEISLETMREIVVAVGGRARCVALSIHTDVSELRQMVEVVQPDILHLCPLAHEITPAILRELRTGLPADLPIMQAVSVVGPESVAESIAYAAVADYLILDTQAPSIPGVGASGATHDWTISRAIVEQVSVPVILAGGLSPENVAEAIRVVRPWGVDSFTHTNLRTRDGRIEKDISRVRAFVVAARAASGTQNAS
jgi:phosphoribosylanthranilate isomerase